ncbi:MAG: 30S ribosomal protein S3, partial [Vicingaceae bacterium]
YGRIGIKVWICKGEVYGKRDLSPNIVSNKGAGKNKHGGGKFRDSKKRN